MTLERIAESRIAIEQARLLTLKTAHLMDTVGNREARREIAMIKIAAPNMACKVIDWAIQAFGGAGVSNDFGLAAAYTTARLLRLADGPDEVHRNQLGRLELRLHAAEGPARTAQHASSRRGREHADRRAVESASVSESVLWERGAAPSSPPPCGPGRCRPGRWSRPT